MDSEATTGSVRLGRIGDRFAVLCCTDGVHWLSCGDPVVNWPAITYTKSGRCVALWEEWTWAF